MPLGRRKKLEKLLSLHGKLSASHEARRTACLAAAAAARCDAETLKSRFDAPGSMFALFPELYHERIARAQARETEERQRADEEGRALARLAMREKALKRHLDQERAWEARMGEERALLEWVETRVSQAPAS